MRVIWEGLTEETRAQRKWEWLSLDRMVIKIMDLTEHPHVDLEIDGVPILLLCEIEGKRHKRGWLREDWFAMPSMEILGSEFSKNERRSVLNETESGNSTFLLMSVFMMSVFISFIRMYMCRGQERETREWILGKCHLKKKGTKGYDFKWTMQDLYNW